MYVISVLILTQLLYWTTISSSYYNIHTNQIHNQNKLIIAKNNKGDKIATSSTLSLSLSLSANTIMAHSDKQRNNQLDQNYQLYFMHFCFAFTSRMWDIIPDMAI